MKNIHNMVDIIAKKRDGYALSNDEIHFFVNGYTNETIPDYQASAFLMAVYLNGMNNNELASLTTEMRDSGDKIDLNFISGTKIDKHSSGGVGDKTTLAVAPMAAACGLCVAKMSGRGLGFSGGTIDKLEAIPGFRTTLSETEFRRFVTSDGLCVMGQTKNIAPADKKIYALRDVTSTVASIPLIAASIMSKKLASGADGIVLDVKTGAGAFMKSSDEAVKLAKTMVDIGESCGKRTLAAVTAMNQPLGFAVGNSLEVIEAIETLKGNAPHDFLELCLKIGSLMLYLGGIAADLPQGENMLLESIENGSALKKLEKMIVNQGGNPQVISDYSLLPQSKFSKPIFATQNGFITQLDGEKIGHASVITGAGRLQKDDVLDLGAGVLLRKKIGDSVEIGDLLATVYANEPEKCDEAGRIVKNAYSIADEAVPAEKILLAVVDKEGVQWK